MNIQQLRSAAQYTKGHILPTVADLILLISTGDVPLADALANAWRAGYDSREEEHRDRIRGHAPQSLSEGQAKECLVNSGAALYVERATIVWHWHDESGGWLVEGDDCLIRPGINGIVVMEAAGEFAGSVVGMDGTIIEFPEGTFLAP